MSEQVGVPYPSEQAGPIDDWSSRIYRSLRDWQLAKQGDWTRWEPGYVLLTVERHGGAEIDPINLYTADGELTVCFGFWETHNPAPYDFWDAEPEIIAAHAKDLVESWVRKDIRTGVFFDKNGKWCGTTMIGPGELEPQLQAMARSLFVAELHPISVEVRTPWIEEWERFEVPFEWFRPSG